MIDYSRINEWDPRDILNENAMQRFALSILKCLIRSATNEDKN